MGNIEKKLGMPTSFGIKCDESNILWRQYIKWLNLKSGENYGGNRDAYYGVTKDGLYDYTTSTHRFDLIITLEEWDELVNGKQNKITVTKEQLKEIHDVACDSWKSKIEKYTLRNPFGNTIEFKQIEINEMFEAATATQKPVLVSIFGEQTKVIDLSTGKLDDKKLFRNPDDSSHSDNFLIAIRGAGNLCSKAFYLNEMFNWEIVTDNQGIKCLVPTRK